MSRIEKDKHGESIGKGKVVFPYPKGDDTSQEFRGKFHPWIYLLYAGSPMTSGI